MLKVSIAFAMALLMWPLAAHGQAMQPIKASPSTPVVSAALGPGGGARLAPSDNIPTAELAAYVDGVVRAAMDENHIAGVTVSVVQDGAVVLKKGYGFAAFSPGRSVDPDTTLFRIGSITKTFTWILLMKAVEEGRIDLDAPVNKYLPADLRIPSQGFTREIRVRDLMTHSPGFEDRALGVIFANTPEKVRPLERWLRETRPNRVREPGVISSYSNYGAALAGEIVAQVEGAPWQDLVESRILQPLNLSHISPREPYPARADLPAPMQELLAKGLSQQFRWNAGGHRLRDFEYITQIAPAGVMSASAGDMARYMLMLLGDGTLDGVTVFGPAAAQAFRTPMTKLPAEVGNWDAGFVDMLHRGGWHTYGHDGGTLSFFSNMTIVPELRLGVFISTNTEGGAKLTGPFAGRLVANFYAPPREPPDPGNLKLADALPYVGEYIPTRRPYSGLGKFIQTLQPIRVAYAPEGYLLATAAGQTGRFVATDQKGVFKSAEGPERVMIELKDGRARSVTVAVAADRASLVEQSSTLALAGALALAAALFTLAGVILRFGRNLPKTKWQGIAGQVQSAAAALWLIGAVAFAMWAARSADVTQIFYGWPAPAVLAASSACLLATLLTLGTIGFLAPVWMGGGSDGWSIWRKLRFTVTSLVFAALGIVLAMRGALEPWTT